MVPHTDDGRVLVTPTLYAGRPGFRAALVNWRTGDRTQRFDAVIDRIDSEIDPASGGVTGFAKQALIARRVGASVVELVEADVEVAMRFEHTTVFVGGALQVGPAVTAKAPRLPEEQVHPEESSLG